MGKEVGCRSGFITIFNFLCSDESEVVCCELSIWRDRGYESKGEGLEWLLKVWDREVI